jgi:hypothetical protein
MSRDRDRDRDDRGRYLETVTPEHVLAFLRRVGGPVTAREVGDEFGVTNRAALNKLDQLHDQDRVERKEVGARAVVWWVEPPIESEDTAPDALEEDPSSNSRPRPAATVTSPRTSMST